MQVGTVKEIKAHEYRVGLTPSCARAYTARGHKVVVESGAGSNAGFSDAEYAAAGAVIETDRKRIFDTCEMIIKVKDPQPSEFDLFHQGQILCTYLHLAASKEVTLALMGKKIKAIAYETIETEDGSLPCLTPMSEIAGRLSVQEGAKYLEKTCKMSPELAKGVNLYMGDCVYYNVAQDLERSYKSLDEAIS